MEKYFGEIKNYINGSKIISSVVVIAISIIIYNIVNGFVNRFFKNKNLENNLSNKGKTYIKLVKSIIRYVFIIITLLIVLQVNDVNVSSLLAGVGIMSAIIGLALQDALKDIIRGFNILSDSYFHVGDVIKYNGAEGKVLAIGLKTTKIKDLASQNEISIANRNIEFVEVVSDKIYLRIPLPYELSLKDAEKFIENILEDVKKVKNVDGVRYLDVDEFADSSINYMIEVTCNPEYKRQVKRSTFRTILDAMNKENISVPYNQIDIHNK